MLSAYFISIVFKFQNCIFLSMHLKIDLCFHHNKYTKKERSWWRLLKKLTNFLFLQLLFNPFFGFLNDKKILNIGMIFLNPLKNKNCNIEFWVIKRWNFSSKLTAKKFVNNADVIPKSLDLLMFDYFINNPVIFLFDWILFLQSCLLN